MPESQDADGDAAASRRRAHVSHQGARQVSQAAANRGRIRHSSISVPSSAPTSRSSASSSGAASASRTSPPISSATSRTDKLDELPTFLDDAIHAGARERRRHPVLGCLRLSRSHVGARRWPHTLTRLLRPDGALLGVLQHRRRPAAGLHQVHRRRRRQRCAIAPIPRRARVRRRCRIATSSRCSRGCA